MEHRVLAVGQGFDLLSQTGANHVGGEGAVVGNEQIEEEIPQAEVAVLSGPSHAEEVALGVPTGCVAASPVRAHAEFVQDAFMSDAFRIYTSPDIVGAELGGAIKNVIALCAGVTDGMGCGDNTKAMLLTRGLAEMARLGVSMGADRDTFAGLAGVGDLTVTCTSRHSRNWEPFALQASRSHFKQGQGYLLSILIPLPFSP